jgi:hypothetical protein
LLWKIRVLVEVGTEILEKKKKTFSSFKDPDTSYFGFIPSSGEC